MNDQSLPWWGPVLALAVILSTWVACLVCGILFGAPVGLTLLALFELRAAFAMAVERWRLTVRRRKPLYGGPGGGNR